jgi:sugar lactone lactonase YvrE
MLTIDPADVDFVGAGLARPECVLATRSGDLFVSDKRGGVAHIDPDGQTKFIAARDHPDGFMPNGIALMPNRDVMIANLGAAGGVWRMTPAGDITLVLSEVDGVALPPPNFVGLDRAERLWVTVSTRRLPREEAFSKGVADGFVVVMEKGGARIVADDIGFTNEAVVDPTGTWLYVNETIGRRTIRFPIRNDGALGPREVVATYPPATFPDGLTFDAEGGVWIVSVASNRVIRVAADGAVHVVLEDADPERMQEIEAAFHAGPIGRDELDAGKARPLGNLASIAFGGLDLKTVFLGSLHGTQIATFRSPIAGAAPVHWNF